MPMKATVTSVGSPSMARQRRQGGERDRQSHYSAEQWTRLLCREGQI